MARVFTLGLLFFFVWKFFWMVYPALFLGLLAILLAIVVHAPARALARWVPFRIGFALSVLVIIGALSALVVALTPQVLEQVTQLAVQLPGALDSAGRWLEDKTGSEPNSQFTQRITQQVGEFVGRFVPLAFNLITTLLGGFALVVLAVFLGAQPQLYRGLLLGLAPPGRRERWERVYDEAGRNLRFWVLGKALTMVLVGVATYVGLTLFGIPGALALATLAALMEFVPNIGPTIAAVPAVIAAFLISPGTALWVALFYFGLQQVQNAITVPLIERRAVDIPPAVLLFWQLMLAVGFGLLALFVATPLLAVLVVAVRVLYYEPAQERESWDRREHHGAEPDEPGEDEFASEPTGAPAPGPGPGVA